MKNRIEQKFDLLKSDEKAAFVAYVTAGDPNLDKSLEILLSIDEAGADIIEIGIPFSDPLADGIVNQMAASRALDSGTTVTHVIDLIRSFREHSQTPLVLFTYLNPIYNYGYEKFHEDASNAGADGILTLDLPPSEEKINEELCQAKGLLPIRLIAPTTPTTRISEIAENALGFIYYVSREGVTGKQTSLADGIEEQIKAIKDLSDLPIVVGFGISSPEQTKDIASMSDGVVVGSAIVDFISQNQNQSNLKELVYNFVKPLADASKSI
ncbi:MAG: tryptophan synthase subunit alpha [Verrucomicrobiales bacterium]|nr:tryptophan synthase subunit alpha [Verrucomicrobiales bacterium]